MDCLYWPPPPTLFHQKPPASPSLLLSSHSTGEAAWESKAGMEMGGGSITWEQTVIMAADALLHFHSCGVAHLWAAITDQMIQTGPCDEVAGLTEWLAALFFFACVHGIVLYAFKESRAAGWVCVYLYSWQ